MRHPTVWTHAHVVESGGGDLASAGGGTVRGRYRHLHPLDGHARARMMRTVSTWPVRQYVENDASRLAVRSGKSDLFRDLNHQSSGSPWLGRQDSNS